MMFENMISSDGMLPLDNILSAQNAANLQNMMAAQGSRMMPQTATLQEMLARQNAAVTQNRQMAENTSTAQSARTMPAQNNAASSNLTPARGMAPVSASPPSHQDAKAQAKQQLAQSCFAVHEAVLYLDTHPDDQNALEYYRRKQQQLIQASENYQKVVGPIRACAVDTSSGSWRWVETPWPWEIEED